ncbi:hypothetical protein C8Q75DRAFT_760372 [Abortiporus biennis]|nr:hypothetical protein C8Q75DRAFT_760372 [Abortiporus biennis]
MVYSIPFLCVYCMIRMSLGAQLGVRYSLSIYHDDFASEGYNPVSGKHEIKSDASPTFSSSCLAGEPIAPVVGV